MIIFGTHVRHVTDRASNQKTFYFPFHLTSASVPGKTRKRQNSIFSLKCRITALPVFNQLLLDFFRCNDSRVIFTPLPRVSPGTPSPLSIHFPIFCSFSFFYSLYLRCYFFIPFLSTRIVPLVSRPEVMEATKPGFSFLCVDFVLSVFS